MNKIVAFTICSANYLAQAKTLAASLRRNNPEWIFVIGLVDRITEALPSGYLSGLNVITAEDLKLPFFETLLRNYNIVELNTALKPYFFTELYNRYADAGYVIYFDPDIYVVGELTPIISETSKASIVLTPHSCTYTLDGRSIQSELAMLGTGVANLGFISTKRTSATESFLQWWSQRLKDYCYYSPGRGLFVDQLWINLGSLYFEGVVFSSNLGLNVSYWNLYERSLEMIEGRWLINKHVPLLFYHFSSYDPACVGMLAKRNPGVSLLERPEVEPLVELYRDELVLNSYEIVSRIPCYFYPAKEVKRSSVLAATSFLNRRLASLFSKSVRAKVSYLAQVTADAWR